VQYATVRFRTLGPSLPNSGIDQGGYTLTGGVVVGPTDTTTGIASSPFMTAYNGPVAGLTNQFIDLNADNLAITATAPSVFLHSGAGEDALRVTDGNNVLDGSTGSNFLVGGSGHDTFFIDDRAATSDIWSTLVNFHAGDSATAWGVTEAGFVFTDTDNRGATGYTGLTIMASAADKPNAPITMPGYSVADLSNGRLSLSFGFDNASGSSYANIHAN
jgi:Ca2+-binding RTX toxin-like protein